MSKIDLTVCIPAYNRPDYLRDALTSLCGQGLKREELVVVVSDDASPTSLEPVVAEFEDRLQIVYSRSQANIGHIANFSRAFELAQTPYISFLPHDDVLAMGQLARAVSLLKSNPKAVAAMGLVVHQKYPGAPDAGVYGFCFRGGCNNQMFLPYDWDQAEWMAATLVTTPFNMVGSVFNAEAFRKCQIWKQFPLWHDRVWCAELALQGGVVSMPWVCGYYRESEEQMSRKLWQSNADEFCRVSILILNLCQKRNIPVLQFWINHICNASPERICWSLDALYKSLPRETFKFIKMECESRLKRKLRLGGRLSKLGLPPSVVRFIRWLLK
jgi:GT2 family glycosyltransferase